jgi:L-lactate dehydrogenase complex protein LldG
MVASPQLDLAQLWDLFDVKAKALGAEVRQTPTAQDAFTLITAAAPGFRVTANLARQHPSQAQRVFQREDTAADDILAHAVFAVAETGSLALDEPSADRGACFLAERLWLLVGRHTIVPTLDVAFERIKALVLSGSTHPLLMSGPSRTADIERVLTIGVHGPRELRIVVVDRV